MTDPSASTATAASLQHLLDAGLAHASEYRGGLSNHLPMALTALQRLGAGDARLRAFAADSATRLVRLDAAAPEFAAAHTLRREIAARDAGAVLAARLPGLMPGVGAAAFHGLIRSAYAVDAIALDDDHVIKLVHACREEAAHYGDDVYRRVAGLAVSA